MENLIINNNPDLICYPKVNFNISGVCEITGESYMEDTYLFYQPVIEWLSEYIKENKPVIFNIKLTYFNTSSSRIILEILDLLKSYKDSNGQVVTNWYYKPEDPDMLMEIKGFEGEAGLSINILPFE